MSEVIKHASCFSFHCYLMELTITYESNHIKNEDNRCEIKIKNWLQKTIISKTNLLSPFFAKNCIPIRHTQAMIVIIGREK